jgi:formylglycine-generating enzyme required for sulfatase activity
MLKIIKIFLLVFSILYSFNLSAQPVSEVFAGIEMIKTPVPDSTEKIDQFWIGKYEITQEQYESIMGKNPSEFRDNKKPVEKVSWYNAVEFCNKLSIKAGYKPYYNIQKEIKDPENTNSYDDIKWLVTVNKDAEGFRLPTSAEWEFAARAGTYTTYFWGESADDSIINQYSVYEKNSNYQTAAAGSKKPNPWGLYDMSGNVWEWCFEWFIHQPGKARVIRGGCWKSDDYFIQPGMIFNLYPYLRWNWVGIRVAKNAK